MCGGEGGGAGGWGVEENNKWVKCEGRTGKWATRMVAGDWHTIQQKLLQRTVASIKKGIIIITDRKLCQERQERGLQL